MMRGRLRFRALVLHGAVVLCGLGPAFESCMSGFRTAVAQDEAADAICGDCETTRAGPFASLFAQIQSGVGDGETLWHAARDSGFVLTNDSGSDGFQFGFFMEGPLSDPNKTGRGFFQTLNEWDGCHVTSLIFGPAQLPLTAYVNDRAFILRDDATWITWSKKGRWAFIVDGDHVFEHFDSRSSPPHFAGFIRFDLPANLSERLGDFTPPTHWDPTSRTLAIHNPNGTKYYLRFRSPNDSLRFGTALGEYWIDCGNTAVQCYRAFQQTANLNTRLQLGDCQNLAEKVGAQIIHRDVQYNVALDTPAKRAAALNMWRQFTAYEPIDYEKSTVGKQDYEELNLRERIVFLTKAGEKLLFADADVEAPVIETLAMNMVEQLRSMAAETDANAPADSLFPDDSVMIWRQIVGIFGPNESRIVVYAAIKLLLSPSVSDEQKAALCGALGDWGYPSFLACGTKLRNVRKDHLFYDAVLRARWQWLCEPKHVEACLDALRLAQPDGEVESAAVETLIRLDALPQVPERALARWYNRHVTYAPEANLRQGLAVLSVQPTGREFLIRRLRNHSDSQRTRKRVANVLASRARATLETKRFDFMPEGRCREILDLVEPSPAN